MKTFHWFRLSALVVLLGRIDTAFLLRLMTKQPRASANHQAARGREGAAPEGAARVSPGYGKEDIEGYMDS
jgi:hypothetical protein